MLRKLFAILLTAGTILIVVMAARDRRPGLWQRSQQNEILTIDTMAMVDTLTIADTTQSICVADTLSAIVADSTAAHTEMTEMMTKDASNQR